jgi:formylglycine-generating enzyme required for sulfatase activity
MTWQPLLLVAVAMLQATNLPAADPVLARVPFEPAKAKSHQQDWATAAGVPVEMTNSIGAKLMLIPPGHFSMGPNGSTYRVTISKPFYIGATEVTLGQYRRFVAEHRIEGAADEFNADDRPAAMVSWDEAQAFCKWLSEQPEERRLGRSYSLPTEAQWEWAARAGTGTTRYFGDDDKRQKEFSWFNDTYTPNPKNEIDGRGRRAVGQLPANAWGLHDMLGNVWEWCDDRRIDERTGETRDPVMRGGSWRSGAFHCTAVAHDPGNPRQKGDNIGLRLVCTLVK